VEIGKLIFKHLLSIRIAIFWCLFFSFTLNAQYFSGKVSDAKNKEVLIGATIYSKKAKSYAITDVNGIFRINTNITDTLRISMIGYLTNEIAVEKSSFLIIELTEYTNNLDEVVVSENEEGNFRQNQFKVSASDINKIPTIFGEKDLVKAIQILPGVKTVVEGGSGFSVRGGSADQNLLLLEEVPLYSYSHLFGLFSMINTDVVKDVEFLKEGVSARYGGRAASILKINLKDGNLEKWNSDINIGIIASKIAINGPIIKNKLTFVFSARRSYLDLALKPFLDKYDFPEYVLKDNNMKVCLRVNKYNKLNVGYYYSSDRYTEYLRNKFSDSLYLQNNDGFSYTNKVNYLNYFYSKGLKNLHVGLYNTIYEFNYNVATNEYSPKNVKNTFQLNYASKIIDRGLKLNSDLLISKINLSVGGGFSQKTASAIYILNNPVFNQYYNYINKPITAYEGFSYVNVDVPLAKDFYLKTGIRFTTFTSNKISKNYLEPRFSIQKQFQSSGYRFSYSQMRQFVHLLSSSGGALPTDIWINANSYAKPSLANQWAIAYFKKFTKGVSKYYLELGSYYKKLNSILEYNNGQNILTITEELAKPENNLKDIFSVGDGKAWGFEMLIRTKHKNFDTQLAYTLSRAFYTFKQINNGGRYYPRFDRLHEFNLLANYNISKKISLSSLLNFGTANPATLPNATFFNLYYDQNNQRYNTDRAMNLISMRNNYRSESYFRLDFSICFNKQKRHFFRTWELGAYNTTLRKNPFYYTSNLIYSSEMKLFRLVAIKNHFLSVIPNINYKIKF
jgi:CarboxypepD_reg-like domain/TonB-dependent Receptor Plug Domain